MVTLSALSIALLSQSVGALRKSSSTSIGGVPIKNYRYRHMQVGAMDGKFDWVLKFHDGLGDEQLLAFCGGDAGFGACSAVGHPSKGGAPLATVRATEEQLEKLFQERPSLVEWAEPDTPVELEPTEDAEAVEASGSPWGLDTIGLTRASFTGKGVHIYVMDTGIRISHQDFEGRAVATIDTISGGGRIKECSPGDGTCASDDNGHGTHVAGTAGGRTFGVAREATLHANKVCCGSGTNILAGMDWIATKGSKPAVMTMSLGSYSTPESSKVAVDAVVNSGVTVTVSAGNRGTPSCEKSYTFIRSAIGVGASGQDNSRAGFSNYGECNAIFAPGVGTISASHRSDTGSSSKSGTSMAAPLVAGVSALILEQDNSRSPAKVRELLQSRAQVDQLTGLRSGDPNLLLWAGATAAPTPVPTPAPAPGTWVVSGSGCAIDGDCIQSNNHPSNYGNNEKCSVQLYGDISLSFDSFETEASYDKLTVGGRSYSGGSGPSNGPYTGSISWSSDGSVTKSGWKFCRA